eukprot:SAG11_NODE_2549_length_3231_cov_3.053640_3_plen_109_part_00
MDGGGWWITAQRDYEFLEVLIIEGKLVSEAVPPNRLLVKVVALAHVRPRSPTEVGFTNQKASVVSSCTSYINCGMDMVTTRYVSMACQLTPVVIITAVHGIRTAVLQP